SLHLWRRCHVVGCARPCRISKRPFQLDWLPSIFPVHIRGQNSDCDVRCNAFGNRRHDRHVPTSHQQRCDPVAVCLRFLAAVGFIVCLLFGGNCQSHQHWASAHFTGLSANLCSLRRRR